MIYWITAGLVVVSVLSCVAVFYLWQLRKLGALKLVEADAIARENLEGRTKIISSIKIISRAFLAGQVESAEACLRLSGLMNQLSLSEQDREAYVAIDKMAASIAHIPIMQDWKVLPKKERRLFEAQIVSKQEELKDFILVAVKDLSEAEF